MRAQMAAMRWLDCLRLLMVGLFALAAVLALVGRNWPQVVSNLAVLAAGLALFIAYRQGRKTGRLVPHELALILTPVAGAIALVPLALRTADGLDLADGGLILAGAAGVIVAVLVSSQRGLLKVSEEPASEASSHPRF